MITVKMRKRWRDENDSKVHEEECNVLLRLIEYKSLAKKVVVVLLVLVLIVFGGIVVDVVGV